MSEAAPGATSEQVTGPGDATVDDVHGNELRWLAPDLARFTIPAGSSITGATMTAFTQVLARRHPHPVRLQVVIGGLYTVTRDAFRASVSSPMADHVYAIAINVNGGAAAGIVNGWLRLYEQPYPARVFPADDLEGAAAWLREVDRDRYERDVPPAMPKRRIAVVIAAPSLVALMLLSVLVFEDGLSMWTRTVLGGASAALLGGALLALRLYRLRLELVEGIQRALEESDLRAESESEALQAVLEEAVEAILTIDETGVIRRYNRAAERLFGYAPDEVLGKNVSMLMPEPDRSRHDRYLSRYHETQQPKIIGKGRDVTALRKDGSTCPVRLSVSKTTDPTGAPVYTGLLVDLTGIRRAEHAERERAEELLEANKDLESFSRALSHDLRTPLRGIQQLAGWISEDLDGDVSSEVAEHLRLLRGRATRLEEMIAQLHAFTSISASQRLKIETLDMNALLDSVVDQLELPAGFEVVRELDDTELRHVRAPMELILRNLIGNAIQHHHRAKGRVWVRTIGHEDGCTLCVEDDGPGIPEKHRERVFEPLQTLRPRDDGGGSGLGLSLVRRTVKQLHGYLVLRESAQGGARFVIDLPLPPLDGPEAAD